MAAGLSPADASATRAMEALGLPRVLAAVSERATTRQGRDAVRSLRPLGSREQAERALGAVEAARRLLDARPGWGVEPVAAVEEPLRRLRVPGAVLEGEELRELAGLLRSIRIACAVLRDEPDADPLGLGERLFEAPDLEERVGRALDESGQVRDGASSELGRLRRALAGRRSDLVRHLEAVARELPDRIRVDDGSVTVRNGRYCIPVRREGKRTVGGLVHDESGSRSTLFIEPPSAIEPMNDVRELELAEAREVRRILAELSEAFAGTADAAVDALDALATLDSVLARARFANQLRAHCPALHDAGTQDLDVRSGRHPILALEEVAVPFDLRLNRRERVLLVSGPNAGGKTVLLKTLGLSCALAACGVVPPVGPETRLPLFTRFFASIGDEQSIENSLSTFGAAVRNLILILERADGSSLVLIDEIGSATDPGEGGALSAAVLARLAETAGLTVATTHLGVLKGLAGERDDVVNASLEFDAAALEPTFRLRRDRPGRSYALEIATRLGLDPALIEAARERLDAGERGLDSVLSELEEDRDRLAGLVAESERRARTLDAREREVAAREEEAGRRDAEAEREARQRQADYLLEARQTVEEAIERLEGAYENARSAETDEDRAAARRSARRAVERSIEGARAEAESTARRAPSRTGTREQDHGRLEPGGRVRLRGAGTVGRLVEIREDRAVVEMQGLRVTVPVTDLEPGPPADGDGTRPRTPASAPLPETVPARHEIDLRGQRVDEIEAPLFGAVDAAIVADLPQLRVIHGKGTGALRQRVRELLEQDPRVTRAEIADPREGGSGVTVVEFR